MEKKTQTTSKISQLFKGVLFLESVSSSVGGGPQDRAWRTERLPPHLIKELAGNLRGTVRRGHISHSDRHSARRGLGTAHDWLKAIQSPCHPHPIRTETTGSALGKPRLY